MLAHGNGVFVTVSQKMHAFQSGLLDEGRKIIEALERLEVANT